MVTKHDYYCRCRMCKPPLVGEARHSHDSVVMWVVVLTCVLTVVSTLKVLP